MQTLTLLRSGSGLPHAGSLRCAALLALLLASCSGGEPASNEVKEPVVLESGSAGDDAAENSSEPESDSSPAPAPAPAPAAAPAFDPASPNVFGDLATEAARGGWHVPPGEAPAVQGFVWKEAEEGGPPHLHLPLRASDHGERTFGVYGPSFGVRAAAWTLGPDAPIPAVFHGRYRVNEWNRHSNVQTLQVVLTAEKPGSSVLLRNKRMEVSLVLFGSDVAPVRSAVRRFHLQGPLEPVVGEWVPFHLPLREIFEAGWNTLPTDYQDLVFTLEARFDALVDLRTGDAVLDVEFDDLYLGEG